MPDVEHPADIRIRRISARRNQMFENYQPPSNVNVYLLVIDNRFIVWQKTLKYQTISLPLRRCMYSLPLRRCMYSRSNASVSPLSYFVVGKSIMCKRRPGLPNRTQRVLVGLPDAMRFNFDAFD